MEYSGPTEVLLDESVDLHAHLRNTKEDGDGRMEMNVRYALGHHGAIVHIGNGNPPILDQASADRELRKARACIHEDAELEIYAAPLMTDSTTREMVLETRLNVPRTVLFWKVFLSGVSNDGGRSVSDFRLVDEALAATYDPAIAAPTMPVHVHAERKFDRNGRRIEMRDREWYAITTDIEEVLERHPRIVLVIKHVSDERTLDRIREWRLRGYAVYAEICPHYFYRCHEDLYEGPGGGTAFNANDLCWPLYKNEVSMYALRATALSGEDWIMYGADWACHVDDPGKSKDVKISEDGVIVGGVTILPAVAKSLVIDLFAEAGRLEHIDAYLSGNARRVHHLPPSRKKVRYVREPEKVVNFITGEGPDGPIRARPFMRGQMQNWKLAA